MGKKVLIKQGDTQDIVNEVIQCFKDSNGQLKEFAPKLKGGTLTDTLNNVWQFWKRHVRYQIDPQGKQLVKEPRAFWALRVGDCKSFSVAVMCTLQELGIKAAFRFTSYDPAIKFPTHVYVVVLNGGEEIPVDCVWRMFGEEKPYIYKWDYNMTDIYRISGLEGISGKVPALMYNIDDDRLTHAELDLAIQKQKLQLEQVIAQRVHGIGTIHDDNYAIEIAAIDNAINEIQAIAGKAKRKEKKLKKAIKKNTKGKGVNKKQARLLEKAGHVVKKRKEGLLKKVGKAIKKVVTAPARLAIKKLLPQHGSFFLYLFLVDPADPVRTAKILAAIPEPVRIKRQKAIDLMNIIVNKLDLKEAQFYAIVRNSIMSKYGQSPEQVLAQWMKDANFQIGILPILAAAGKGILSLLKGIGAKIQSDLEQYAPDASDFTGTISPELKTELAKQVTDLPGNNDPAAGKGTLPANYIDREYARNADSSEPVADNGAADVMPADDKGTGEKRELDPPKDPPKDPEKKNNTGLIIGLAAVGVAAVALASGRKKAS